MSMTKLEISVKQELIYMLADEGYSKTYCPILNKLDVNLTDDPGVIAFFEASRGRIVLNKGLDEDQLSVIIRHEILHYVLEHEMRGIKKLAAKHGIDVDLDELTIEKLKTELYSTMSREMPDASIMNLAGDYEISNKGYNEEDKPEIKAIRLNGMILQGLVTDYDHPEWVDLSFEELYDKIIEREEQLQNQAKDSLANDSNDGLVIEGALADPVTFIGADGRKYGI